MMPTSRDELLSGLARSAADSVDLESLVAQYVILRKESNTTSIGLCPFHDEEMPSFTILKRRNRYHCFGCGESGDAVDFLMKHEAINKLSAIETVKSHAKKYPNKGVSIIKEACY